MKTKILLVDDHPIFRKGLNILLDGEETMRVVGEAGDGQEAMDMVREKQPDVVVMDISMPNVNGVEATKIILSEFPDIKIIALSIHSGKRFVENMLRAGAAGYILKESVPEELVDGILKVVQGDAYLSDAITGVLVSEYRKAPSTRHTDKHAVELSEVEKEFLQLTADGMASQHISERLGISLETLDELRYRMMERYHIENEADLPNTAMLAISRSRSDEHGNTDPYPVSVMKTKLRRPPLPSDLVFRSELIKRLEQGQELPLTLVSAPAGYGKTILISCWLDSQDTPSAWFSIDEKDNDVLIFLSHLIAAVRTLFADAFPETLQLLNAANTPPIEVLVEGLTNELDLIDDRFILVMDDFHLIHEKLIQKLLDGLIRHPGHAMHLVLCGRRDPFLPLSSLRAKNQVHEVLLRDLRFSVRETAEYLGKVLDHQIDEASAIQWADKTEGWITGLRLASLSVRHQSDHARLLPELKGGIQYITEYLFNEVLSHQSPEAMQYLLCSSVVDQFCAPLCDALMDNDKAPDTQELSGWQFINVLKKENIFVIHLDAENYWLRYHHQFQYLLQNQLKRHYSDSDIAELHARAQRWYQREGLIDDAIQHALTAGDIDGAAQLVEQNRQSVLNTDKWYILEQWVARLPEAVKNERPAILLTMAWIAYHKFRVAEIPPLIERIQTLTGQESAVDPALEGELCLFRSYVACMQGQGEDSLAYAQQALDQLPVEYELARADAEIYLGLARQMIGQKDVAISSLKEKLGIQSRQEGLLVSRLDATAAFVHLIDGNLPAADQAAIQLVRVAKQSRFDYTGLWGGHIRGCCALQAYDLETACSLFRAIAIHKYIHRTRFFISGMAGLAWTYQAMQRPAQADETVRDLRLFAEESGDPQNQLIAESCQARISLLRGDPEPAVRWLQTYNETVDPPSMLFFLEIPAITCNRVLIADGSDGCLDEAESRLAELWKSTRAIHNIFQLVEIGVLRAVVLQKMGRLDEALTLLERTISLSQPGGWVRPFVEAGPPMTELLKRLAQKNVAVAYTGRLLAVSAEEAPETEPEAICPAPPSSPASALRDTAVQPLIDPLTNRELDILEQLARRLQNKEIAAKLCISDETVKGHLRKIYQKLNANNRRQAVEIAKNYGIL